MKTYFGKKFAVWAKLTRVTDRQTDRHTDGEGISLVELKRVPSRSDNGFYVTN